MLSVGTGYLFGVGTTLIFKGDGQFFEAVAVVLVFILLGHWLEMRARAGASSAITALMNLTPMKASVMRNGAEMEVPTAEVLAGGSCHLAGAQDSGRRQSMLTGRVHASPEGAGRHGNRCDHQ